MNAFSAVFLAALAVSVGMRLWLARRHIRHIVAHRAAVPGEFASSITLEAHQKAADYSSVRTRFGMLHSVCTAKCTRPCASCVRPIVYCSDAI